VSWPSSSGWCIIRPGGTRHLPLELGQLVPEQDAMVSLAHLARTENRAAADDAGVGSYGIRTPLVRASGTPAFRTSALGPRPRELTVNTRIQPGRCPVCWRDGDEHHLMACQ
jgi:hypothetical protein